MNRIAPVGLVACLMTAAACSSAEDTQVEMVSQSCAVEVGDVPNIKSRVVDEAGAGEYDVVVSPPNGGVARIDFSDGTAVDQLDQNARVTTVGCFGGPEQIFPDTLMDVSWSPDGHTFTLKRRRTPGPTGSLEERPGGIHRRRNRVLLEGLVGKGTEVSQAVIDSFDCGDDVATYAVSQSVECTVENQGTKTLLAAISEWSPGEIQGASLDAAK